jgi:hypothetical protein
MSLPITVPGWAVPPCWSAFFSAAILAAVEASIGAQSFMKYKKYLASTPNE